MDEMTKMIYERQCMFGNENLGKCAEFIDKECHLYDGGITELIGTSFLNKYGKCKGYKTDKQLDKIEHESELYQSYTKEEV